MLCTGLIRTDGLFTDSTMVDNKKRPVFLFGWAGRETSADDPVGPPPPPPPPSPRLPPLLLPRPPPEQLSVIKKSGPVVNATVPEGQRW